MTPVIDYLMHEPVYGVLLLCGAILALLFSVLIAVRVTRFRLARAFDKNAKQIALQVDERVSELRDQISKLSRAQGQIIEAARKGIREEVSHLSSQVTDSMTDMDGSVKGAAQGAQTLTKEIKDLFEQQAVFLHDRFSEVSARETRLLHQLTETVTSRQGSDFEGLKEQIVSHLAELMLKERALQQEVQTQTTTMISDSINRLASEVDIKLTMVTDKVSNRFSENLASTMASFNTLSRQIDALIEAKKDIDALGQDVTSLTRLILSKGGGGATHGHLPDMLSAMLPSDSYILNPMINGFSAAAQLMLPGENGAVVVDAAVPLELFDAVIAPDAPESTRTEARARFGDTVLQHIDHVADRFIAPPTTGANAILFVPSETAFAEIQAHHQPCIARATERQVWIVSPTTFAAALNMARSALKDQKARRQLEQMRAVLGTLVQEVQNFETRLLEIGDHVSNAARSVKRAESAGAKLFGDVRDVASIAAEDEAPPLPAHPADRAA